MGYDGNVLCESIWKVSPIVIIDLSPAGSLLSLDRLPLECSWRLFRFLASLDAEKRAGEILLRHASFTQLDSDRRTIKLRQSKSRVRFGVSGLGLCQKTNGNRLAVEEARQVVGDAPVDA